MKGNSKRNHIFILLWLISITGHLLHGSVLLYPSLSIAESSVNSIEISAIVGDLKVSESDVAPYASADTETSQEEGSSSEKPTRLSVYQISAGSASPILVPIAAIVPFERVFLPESDRQVLASVPLVFVALLKFYRILLISIISTNAP